MIEKVLWIWTGKLYILTIHTKPAELHVQNRNCTCNGPPSHISFCIFCGCHLDFRVVFSHFTLYLSDVFSSPNNFSKYENMYINNNFNKLPIIDEDVCLEFPSPPFHVILQRRYANDMTVCDCFFSKRNKINLMHLLYFTIK